MRNKIITGVTILAVVTGSFYLGRFTGPKQKLVPVVLSVARACLDSQGAESTAQKVSLTRRPIYFDPQRGMVAAGIPQNEEPYLIQFQPCPSSAVGTKFYAAMTH
jgi:hypothetical protein